MNKNVLWSIIIGAIVVALIASITISTMRENARKKVIQQNILNESLTTQTAPVSAGTPVVVPDGKGINQSK